MQFVSGDTTKHDNDMEAIEWISVDEVENKLTYKTDKQVWIEAKKELGSRV